MTDLIEQIVADWLGQRGFFVIPNIHIGVREVDLLAIKIQEGRVVKCVHVECQVSEHPISYLGCKSAKKKNDRQVEKCVKSYIKNKFLHPKVIKTLKNLTGCKCDHWMIVGNFKGSKTKTYLRKYDVKVYSIREVVKELKDAKSGLTGGGKRFQQLMRLTTS